MPLITSDAGPFASADDLADRLGLTLTEDERARATGLLVRASGLVRDEARQTINEVADDTLTLVGTNADRILLPERPVASVASVTLDGDTLAGWYLDGNAIVRNGYDVLGGALVGCYGFGWPTQVLEIVYSHGYATPPETVVSIVLEAVIRAWVNPGSVVNERHGSESVQYTQGNPTGMLLTDAERRAIRRLFGRRAGSVNQS